MLITHSYLGVTRGEHRCLFFLLLEDYIQEQTQFFRELELYLEKFARDLSGAGGLVRPFTGDIDQVRRDVLKKPWTEQEAEEIDKTPGLLMINADSFDSFDPRTHAWLQLHFGQKLYEGIPGAYQLGNSLSELATAVKESEKDIFEVAYSIMNPLPVSDAVKIFTAKPGIFGFSVDLIQGATVLKQLCKLMVREQI